MSGSDAMRRVERVPLALLSCEQLERDNRHGYNAIVDF